MRRRECECAKAKGRESERAKMRWRSAKLRRRKCKDAKKRYYHRTLNFALSPTQLRTFVLAFYIHRALHRLKKIKAVKITSTTKDEILRKNVHSMCGSGNFSGGEGRDSERYVCLPGFAGGVGWGFQGIFSVI